MDPFCYLCFVFDGHTLLSVFVALWSAPGKGLTSIVCDVFLCFCHFPYGVLGQVWNLIVSSPGLCIYRSHFTARRAQGHCRQGCTLYSDSSSRLINSRFSMKTYVKSYTFWICHILPLLPLGCVPVNPQ